MDTDTIDGLLTIVGAAQRLGVSPSRVRQLLQAGRLPRTRRVRHVVLIDPAAVDAMAAQGRKAGRPRRNQQVAEKD